MSRCGRQRVPLKCTLETEQRGWAFEGKNSSDREPVRRVTFRETPVESQPRLSSTSLPV